MRRVTGVITSPEKRWNPSPGLSLGASSRFTTSSPGTSSLQVASLTWTSPGFDLYTGVASGLELRYHERHGIDFHFHKGYEVTASHLSSGNLTPRPVDELHTITLQIYSQMVKRILSNQGLNIQEGEKRARNRMNCNDVVYQGRCAINGMNQGM